MGWSHNSFPGWFLLQIILVLLCKTKPKTVVQKNTLFQHLLESFLTATQHSTETRNGLWEFCFTCSILSLPLCPPCSTCYGLKPKKCSQFYLVLLNLMLCKTHYILNIKVCLKDTYSHKTQNIQFCDSHASKTDMRAKDRRILIINVSPVCFNIVNLDRSDSIQY